MIKRYKVTCLQCGESDVLTIDEDQHTVIDYVKKMITPFISFRWRADHSWGYFCKCGNDNRLCQQEKNNIDKLVSADPVSLKKIVESLSIPDNTQFKMKEL